MSPILIDGTIMISKAKVQELVKGHMEGTELFLVDVHVSPSNSIRVLVDRKEGVTLDECIRLSRALENSLDRDAGDFSLEVSSPGLSEPLKVFPQYQMNLGREVEILTMDGDKLRGKLKQVTQEQVTIEVPVRIKGEKKRPETKLIDKQLGFESIRSAKLVIKIK